MTSRFWNRWAALGLGILTVALGWAAPALAAVQPEAGIGLPRDASVFGHLIDEFIMEDIMVETPLFVAMCLWLIAAVIFYNASRGHKAMYDHGSWKNPVAVGICAVAVFVLAADDVYSWFKSNNLLDTYFWNFKQAEANAKTVRVEINAHQWAWNFRYPGPDGKFNTPDDIVTLNDLRVPNDAPVVVELTSVDVIHSFWLPNMRAKEDAVPGMVNRMVFYPKDVGEYDIGCAQHCGVNHYKMKGLLTVLSRNDYEMWASEASQNTARMWDPDDSIAHWGWDWTWKKD
jgi:cytochrome c oxidase subunit 2